MSRMSDLSIQQKLENLHRKMRLCRLCLQDGHDIYPRAIFSGRHSAKIMTIGQAPGITEKEAGRPFNAGSGKRLFEWLALAGIEESWFRETQYMSSVTKCYPGRAKSGSGDRVPSRKEQSLCRPFLDEEIALVNPALIIPIGRLAINLFFPAKQPLREIIGMEKTIEDRWVVPLPHSSGASRWHQSPENRARIDQAIKRIAQHVRSLFDTDTTV
jgi:uracil-DNA glycosylase